mmetsp:Transcript_3708/g.11681  ORF Transcript_3708/g.11681 Transcript_3708/m.11681 type:complete len:247 (-) Transcript_3708:382-1122(-)
MGCQVARLCGPGGRPSQAASSRKGPARSRRPEAEGLEGPVKSRGLKSRSACLRCSRLLQGCTVGCTVGGGAAPRAAPPRAGPLRCRGLLCLLGALGCRAGLPWALLPCLRRAALLGPHPHGDPAVHSDPVELRRRGPERVEEGVAALPAGSEHHRLHGEVDVGARRPRERRFEPHVVGIGGEDMHGVALGIHPMAQQGLGRQQAVGAGLGLCHRPRGRHEPGGFLGVFGVPGCRFWALCPWSEGIQ